MTDLLNPEHQVSISYCNAEDVRHGVSVCDSIEELATYLAGSGIEWTFESVVVELDGYDADEDDQDAHLGARLIIPTEIVSVTPITDELLDLILAAAE